MKTRTSAKTRKGKLHIKKVVFNPIIEEKTPVNSEETPVNSERKFEKIGLTEVTGMDERTLDPREKQRLEFLIHKDGYF